MIADLITATILNAIEEARDELCGEFVETADTRHKEETCKMLCAAFTLAASIEKKLDKLVYCFWLTTSGKIVLAIKNGREMCISVENSTEHDEA